MVALKWRTFTVEFNPKQVKLYNQMLKNQLIYVQMQTYSHCLMNQEHVRLPTLMVETVGSELGSFVVLNDPAYNEIEVLVEKKDGGVCFSAGWQQLKSLYDLQHGGMVTLVHVQASRFVIQVKDRYGEEIKYPHHVPQMSCKLDHDMFPLPPGSLFTTNPILLYSHDPNNFKYSFSKWLSVYEADKGFRVWCCAYIKSCTLINYICHVKIRITDAFD